MTADRRRLVVLGVVAAVAVVLFVVGVGLGGGSGDVGVWRERLEGLTPEEDLTTADLTVAAGRCELRDGRVLVVGACRLEVTRTGGRFSLGAPTRAADLVGVDSPIDVTLTVEGETVETEVGLDERRRVTVGRSGGILGLSCDVPPSCQVLLAPAR